MQPPFGQEDQDTLLRKLLGGITKSSDLFTDPSGYFSAQSRQQQCETLVKIIFDSQDISTSHVSHGKPQFLYIGGGAASGKSTMGNLISGAHEKTGEKYLFLTGELLRQYLPCLKFLKEISANQEALHRHGMTGENYSQKLPSPGETFSEEVQDLMDIILMRAMEKGINVVLEGHMMDAERMRKRIEMARTSGYTTTLLHMHCDMDKVFVRGVERQKRVITKNFKPERTQLQHLTFAQNWPLCEKLFDNILIVDNNEALPKACYIREQNHVEILDEKGYEGFCRKNNQGKSSGAIAEDSRNITEPQSAGMGSNKEKDGRHGDINASFVRRLVNKIPPSNQTSK